MTADAAFRRPALYVAFWIGLLGVLYVDLARAQAAILVLAAIWAFRSPFHGVQALSVTLMTTMVNTGVAPIYGGVVAADSTVTALRMIIIVIVAGRSAYERMVRPDHPSDAIILRSILFILVIAGLSLLTSPMVDVSLFKIALFSVGIVAVVLAISFAAQDHRDELFLWFWGWFAAIVVASLPLLALPFGYVTNNTGFQGWFNQPQGAGIFFAPVAIFFLGLSFFDRLWPRLNLLLGLAATVELFATLSRNSLLALVIAAAVGIIVSFIREPRRWTAVAMFGALGGLLLLALPATQDFLLGVIIKDSRLTDVDVTESFQRSRGFLVDRAMQNFWESPFLGNGFGVATDPTMMTISRDPIFGFPISAAVEKGVLWVAILEEIGLVGAALFALMMIPLFRGALTHQPATAVAIAVAALMTNNGESALFSFGGFGLYMWMVMLFAHGAGSRKTA